MYPIHVSRRAQTAGVDNSRNDETWTGMAGQTVKHQAAWQTLLVSDRLRQCCYVDYVITMGAVYGSILIKLDHYEVNLIDCRY